MKKFTFKISSTLKISFEKTSLAHSSSDYTQTYPQELWTNIKVNEMQMLPSFFNMHNCPLWDNPDKSFFER